MNFCRKCQKCGKMYLMSLFDRGLCSECEKAEQESIYNKLSFPKTFDELVEQYGITDTDEVYTNGLKLIPAFRVKQWLMEANINGYTEGLKDSSKSETVTEFADRWCNTCEFKHLESECLGCAEYDEYDNLINLRNYKKEK